MLDFLFCLHYKKRDTIKYYMFKLLINCGAIQKNTSN